MFEVKKTEHINKTFRIPLDLVRELERLAQAENVSLNNLVVQCCEYALQRSCKSDYLRKDRGGK